MPLPCENTSVFEVPRSMARSEENRLNTDLMLRPFLFGIFFSPRRNANSDPRSSLSSWDSATSTTANTSREPQHASAISRQTRDLPSDIARLAGSHRNDDVGSHDLPSTAPFDCLRSLQSRQWCVQRTASQRTGLFLSRSSMGNARNARGKTSGFERLGTPTLRSHPEVRKEAAPKGSN